MVKRVRVISNGPGRAESTRKPKKTRQGNSHNTKYGNKNSKLYKKQKRGQG